MSTRGNASTELGRFWLQERHGCLLDEELPVPVPYALSDIDLVAMQPDLSTFTTPDGTTIGSRVIVEVEAEHDWDRTGREFGRLLEKDAELLDDGGWIPAGMRGVKFVMLRQEHAERATAYFGTDDFDRLFIVHALDPRVRAELTPRLAELHIYWMTIPELIDDVCTWCQYHPRRAALRRALTGNEHSPLVQAAIAHAQFETIHPFADGNGRSGRALIHVILRRRGLSPTFVPPISLVLATWSDDYISGLTAFRHLDPADSPERSLAAHTWLRTFAGATLRACNDAQIYAARVDELVHEWRLSLGTVRKGSALDLLLDVLPGVPLLTVESAAGLIDRSDVATGAVVNRLVDAGILTQRNIGRQRYRIFEAPTVLDLFTSLERALAGPTGDTATDEPARPVPKSPPTR